MPNNLAILVGNDSYDFLEDLSSCRNDVAAVYSVLEQSRQYDKIIQLTDVNSRALKGRLRQLYDDHDDIGKVFFYFSGHGEIVNGDFIHCTTDTSLDTPNRTGLSTRELHETIRQMSPSLFVSVIDSCYSGTRLIKSSTEVVIPSGEFDQLIRIASCADWQEALAGSHLSPFTEKFIESIAYFKKGPVTYHDIIGYLRDEYQGSPLFPQFTTQGDANQLFSPIPIDIDLCKLLGHPGSSSSSGEDDSLQNHQDQDDINLTERMKSILQDKEIALITREKAQSYISQIHKIVQETIELDEIAQEFFDLSYKSYDSYDLIDEPEPLVRSLSGMPRSDALFSVKVERKEKRQPAYAGFAVSSLLQAMRGKEFETIYELELNCELEGAYSIVTLNPKYRSILQPTLELVFTPTLEHCHLFYREERRLLTDWDQSYFSADNKSSWKRLQLDWNDSPKETALYCAHSLLGFMEVALKQATGMANIKPEKEK